MDWGNILSTVTAGLLVVGTGAVIKIITSIITLDTRVTSHERLDDSRFNTVHNTLEEIHSDVREVRSLILTPHNQINKTTQS
jgi:hypothetical protein